MRGENLIDLTEARRVVEGLARDDMLVRGSGVLSNIQIFVNCRRTAEHDARCTWRATDYGQAEHTAAAMLTCSGETRVSVVDGTLQPRRILSTSRMCSE